MNRFFKHLLMLKFLIITPLLAEDAFINLCCPGSSQSSVKQDLKLILIKDKDQMSEEKGCYKIFASKKREKIISALVRMKHPRCKFDSTLSPHHQGPQCNLEIEQVSRTQNSNQQIGFDHPSIILNRGDFKHTGNAVYQIYTMNNKSGSIQLGHNQVQVHCQVDVNQKNYSLEVIVQSLINQNLNSSKTSLTLSKGQKREISHLFNQNENNSRHIDLNRGFILRNNSGKSEYQYYIYVKP